MSSPTKVIDSFLNQKQQQQDQMVDPIRNEKYDPTTRRRYPCDDLIESEPQPQQKPQPPMQSQPRSKKRTPYTPYQTQAGGKHYANAIQPIQFIHSNDLNFNQGNVVKYISRHKNKNGIEDIKKALHYCLIEAYQQYPDQFDNFIGWLDEEINPPARVIEVKDYE